MARIENLIIFKENIDKAINIALDVLPFNKIAYHISGKLVVVSVYCTDKQYKELKEKLSYL